MVDCVFSGKWEGARGRFFRSYRWGPGYDPAGTTFRAWTHPKDPDQQRPHNSLMIAMMKIARRPRFDDESPLPSAPPLPANASAGKRWRFRRNLVIYLAHRQGLSQRFLSDVFDLPRSRIAEIIKELSVYEKTDA